MFSPLSPSVCYIVPFMFSHVLLPLVTTTGLLPPLSSPVPLLFISVCVCSLCLPFTPCPALYSVCMHLLLSCPLSLPLVCVFGFGFLHFCMFDLNVAFCLHFVLLFLCYFVSRALVIHASWLFLYSCIFCFFVDFGFCLLNLASDSPDLASRLSDCTWSHLPSNPA